MKTHFEKLIYEQILNIKPFEEDNTSMEQIFFYLSEITGELGFKNLSDLCLEIVLYCKGSESADLSYKTKADLIEHYQKQIK